MRRIAVLFLVLQIARLSQQCIVLYCPGLQMDDTSECSSKCSSCSRGGKRLCATTEANRCGCLSDIPKTCKRAAIPGVQPTRICYFPADAVPPSPIVRIRGNVVSTTVPRFFKHPPFSALSLSNLTLYFRFVTKNKTKCEPLSSILSYKRRDNECLYRVKLSIPGVDSKTDDHYYYDDGSELETEFSSEMFEDSEDFFVWDVVTVGEDFVIEGQKKRITSIARSPSTRHDLHAKKPRPSHQRVKLTKKKPTAKVRKSLRSHSTTRHDRQKANPMHRHRSEGKARIRLHRNIANKSKNR